MNQQHLLPPQLTPVGSTPRAMPTSFDDVPISTKTIIIDNNIEINLPHVFKTLPVVSFADTDAAPSDTTAVSALSKKKLKKFIANCNLPDGAITSIGYSPANLGANEPAYRGIKIKNFRNAMTVVMTIDGKDINFKVPYNGRIQITGCKEDRYAEECIKHLWTYLYNDPISQRYREAEAAGESVTDLPWLYRFHAGDERFHAILHVVMSNRNFKLGFTVNRTNLDRYVNTQDNLPWTSLLETTFGYTGVNIKLPCNHQNIVMSTLTCAPDGEWTHGTMCYDEYLKTLSPRDYARAIAKSYRNSFLIFRSGSAIMSGIDAEHMESDYYRFTDMIRKIRPRIDEHFK